MASLSLSLFFFPKEEKVRTEGSEVERGHFHSTQHSGGKPLHGNSAPIVRPLARLPCCFQEALCAASAKAIFSYGVTERQRAARGFNVKEHGGE